MCGQGRRKCQGGRRKCGRGRRWLPWRWRSLPVLIHTIRNIAGRPVGRVQTHLPSLHLTTHRLPPLTKGPGGLGIRQRGLLTRGAAGRPGAGTAREAGQGHLEAPLQWTPGQAGGVQAGGRWGCRGGTGVVRSPGRVPLRLGICHADVTRGQQERVQRVRAER